VVGDNIHGTLVSVREVNSTLPNSKPGDKTKVYEVKADGGSFHDLDDKKKVIEEAVEIGAGEIGNIGGGFMLSVQFRNIKLGQKVKIEYTGDKAAKAKGFNPMKIKKVFTNGKVDQDWVAEQEAKAKEEEDMGGY